jgi:hypothetical protein
MSQEPAQNVDRLEIKVPDMLGYNTMARKISGTPEQSIERHATNKLTTGSRRSSQVSLSKAIYDEAQRILEQRVHPETLGPKNQAHSRIQINKHLQKNSNHARVQRMMLNKNSSSKLLNQHKSPALNNRLP